MVLGVSGLLMDGWMVGWFINHPISISNIGHYFFFRNGQNIPQWWDSEEDDGKRPGEG